MRLEPAEPRALVLFAVGAGGDPERHRPLLQTLADAGCLVIAPEFERLTSPMPTAEQLTARAQILQCAFDTFARPDLPATGVGHSIGAALLLMLAGAKASTQTGEIVTVALEPRLRRLALLAPATDFFQTPGALDGLHADLAIWSGDRDTITPPHTTERLRAALQPATRVTLHPVPGADHFSFMNICPPHMPDTMPDRADIIVRMADAVVRFVTG